MTLNYSFSICPSHSLCVPQFDWDCRRSATCSLHDATHQHTHIHTTWHVAVVLRLVQNHDRVTSRMQRSGTLPWQQLTFGACWSSDGLLKVCQCPAREWFTPILKMEILAGFWLTTWFLNMIHQSGFMLRDWCWHLYLGTSHAYLLCIGVFTLPLQKNLLLPICLSVCLSGKANYVFLCFFLRLFLFE